MSKAPTNQEVKSSLQISDVLKYYGGECVNQSNGAWWCLVHEKGGRKTGHKTPSLVAKDSSGTATCMSQNCFSSDNIFGVIAKMENMDIKNDFNEVKKKACDIAEIDIKVKREGMKTKGQNTDKERTGEMKSEGREGSAIDAQYPMNELQKEHIEHLSNIGISKKTAYFFKLKSRYNYILYPQIRKEKTLGYKGISITKDSETGKSKIFFEGEKEELWGNTEGVGGKHLIFTEGEKDCMRLYEEIKKEKKVGEFCTLTVTTGAKTVPRNILHNIKSLNPKKISIIYDNDKAGYEGSTKLAEVLTEIMDNISIYRFNLDNKKGYDVTDFLNEGGNLKNLFALKREEVFKEKKGDGKYRKFIIPVTQDELQDEIKKSSDLLCTGYTIQEEKLLIPPSAISIFVAPTSHGKTMMQSNLAINIATLYPKKSVYFFSYEEQRCDILLKMLNSYCGMELSKNNFRTIKQEFSGNIDYIKSVIRNSEAYREVYTAKKKEFFDTLISANRLSVHYIEQSVEELIKTIEYLKKSTNVGVVIIDYIQLLFSDEKQKFSRQEELKIICQKLKSCAINTGIPIILGSQFNRQVVSSKDLVATNIGEAGDIERIAGLVVGMWNNNFNLENTDNSIILKILKNRNGKSGLEDSFTIDGNLSKIFTNNNNIQIQESKTRYNY